MAKLFESKFMKDVMVAVVDKADYQYQTLVPLFNEYGYGFVSPDKKLIFIDGELDITIQKIVEAHEVGHIAMGHGKHYGPTHEAEADCWAILTLRNYNEYAAANQLVRQFKGRHGYAFYHKKNSLNREKSKIYLVI